MRPLLDLPARLLSPPSWTFRTEDAFSPLWGATIGPLPPSLLQAVCGAWPALARQQVRARLALTLRAGGEVAIARLAREHTERLAAKWEEMPRLPAERKALLIQQAEQSGAELGAALKVLHSQLSCRNHGVQMLCQLAARLDVQDETGLAQRCDGVAAGVRGRMHEESAIRWAREQWPEDRYRVVGSCCVIGDALQLNRAFRGVKQEFDAIVVARAACSDGRGAATGVDTEDACKWGHRDNGDTVVAIVEAKAGVSLFSDLPKLLAFRSFFEHSRPEMKTTIASPSECGQLPEARAAVDGKRNTADVACASMLPRTVQLRRRGGRGRAQDESVCTGQSVELIYVFGSGSSLSEVANTSALSVEAGVMLAEQLGLAAREAKNAVMMQEADGVFSSRGYILDDEDDTKCAAQLAMDEEGAAWGLTLVNGRVRAEFREEVKLASQRRLDQFHDLLCSLMQRREVKFFAADEDK